MAEYHKDWKLFIRFPDMEVIVNNKELYPWNWTHMFD